MTQEKNVVLSWAGDVKGAEYGFIKAVVYALEQFKEKNNKPLYTMVALCNGKPYVGRRGIVPKDKLVYAPALKRIVDQALSGLTLEYSVKTQDFKVKAASPQAGLNGDVLETLRMLAVIPNMSIRHEQFKKHFPKPEAVKKQRAAEAVAKSITKLLMDNALQIGDVMDLVRAAVAANPKGEPEH